MTHPLYTLGEDPLWLFPLPPFFMFLRKRAMWHPDPKLVQPGGQAGITFHSRTPQHGLVPSPK